MGERELVMLGSLMIRSDRLEDPVNPRLSVVVPFYNAEPYLEECLGSLAVQSLRDIQVVMVDDGSTDNGAVCAKNFAGRDQRFVLLQQENRGTASARNAGLRVADAELLAFADAEDVVPRNGYEVLVASLEHTGSELACGSMSQLEDGRLTPWWQHASAFKVVQRQTHISKSPSLIRDLGVWNKVCRRALWEANGLEFEAYGDALVAMRTHVLAEAVDVLDNVVYHRRKKTWLAEVDSADVQAIEARLTGALSICDLLASQAPKAAPDYFEYLMVSDLKIFFASLPKVVEADQERLLDLGASVTALFDRATVRRMPSRHRLLLHLLQTRRFEELLSLLKEGERTPEIVRKGWLRRRWYVSDAKIPPVPRRLLDVTDELSLEGRVDRANWIDGALRLEGHVYLNGLELSSPDDSTIRLWLQDPKRGRRTDLPITRVRRPDVTAASNALTSYEWSGWTADVDPAALARADWELHAQVTVQGAKRSGRVGNPRNTMMRWTPGTRVGDGLWVRPTAWPSGFVVRVRRATAVATAHRLADGLVEITGWTSKDAQKRLVASTETGETISTKIELTDRAEGGYNFRACMPLAELTALDPTPGIAPVAEWSLALSDGKTSTKLVVAGEVLDASYVLGGRELVVRSRNGTMSAISRDCRVMVNRVAWEQDNLVVHGDHLGVTGRPTELVLRHSRSAEEHVLPMTWKGKELTVVFAPAAMPLLGMTQPLFPGAWLLMTRTADGEERELDVRRHPLVEVPEARRAGAHRIEFELREALGLRLIVRPALAEAERGTYAQERLKTIDYPALLRQPTKPLAVFDAFLARHFACNPRGVYEELQRQGTELECVWASRHGQFTVSPDGKLVLVGSRDHYETMARARYIIGNEAQPNWFVKRPDQVYVQCWHGTPLKRLALDVQAAPHLREATRRWINREVPRWDLLLSPNPFTTPILRQAYEYEGEILESGYPRNDVLMSQGRDRIRAETRRRLGIAEGKRVVLYVPTWRDNFYLGGGRRGFDLALDLDRVRAALGEDHVLLLRTHYLITDRSWSQRDDVVLDVSRYPDIAELYLAADLLVTDYSSAMFDFAVTGKPIVFFAYDLEQYRDEVRGFYFDLEAEAPGPVVRTSDEVIAAIGEMDSIRNQYGEAYAAFVKKFCPFDDGHAASRVIKRFLELGQRC